MKPLRILAAALLMLPVIAWAQKESLLIGPGDEVRVQVFDTPEMDSSARVDDHGDLPLIMGGTVHVAGLSPAQAATAIEQGLVHRRLMNAPRVLVTVEHYATANVTVFGQVVHPAAYEISTARPLTDVLSLAGGFTDLADRHVTIHHHDGSPMETVFVSNDPANDAGEKALVLPGDTVTVPKEGLVYVLGDVNRAGGFPMSNNDSGMTVLQAVAKAGGTSHTAVPSHAMLIREVNGDDHKRIPIQLSAMQKGKRPDMQLQPNDIIYVPFSYTKNAVLGITSIIGSAAGAAIYVY